MPVFRQMFPLPTSIFLLLQSVNKHPILHSNKMKMLSKYLLVLWENKTIANRMFLNLHPLQILVPCIAGSASGARPQSWWRGEKNPSINLVPRAPQSLVLFPAPPPKPRKSALGTRLAINIFQKVSIRKMRFPNILERSVLEKLNFFTSCPYETTQGEFY